MTFIWFLTAIIYVLVVPKLLDLMTGYVTNSTAMIAQDRDYVPVSLQDPSPQYYTESIGWMYGTTGVTCIPSNTYQWGFSSLWAEVALDMTAVWCWGMFGL
jgi:hypothetical protein